ncbi:MAG: SPFH/Band 7/PHB domain protein [Elusimicrobiota bacterium]|jgi:regulator of protease activity HflC (stomatin/prohibitin superfamily)|nr:SPFH/Band 7/PHB domain protein [Elusimicrobiota bacterium]
MEIIIVALAFAVFAAIFFATAIRIVKQAEVMVIERLGSYNRTLASGPNFVIPFFDKARQIEWKFSRDIGGRSISYMEQLDRIDLRETVYDFPQQAVITKDNVSIQINALIYFQITDPLKAVYQVASLPMAIEKLTQTTLRNVIGELELDQTLISRETINAKLRAILDEASNKWGVKVNRVELQDITPPPAIRDAMEKQMRAERERRAIILEAEGNKRSQILKAEGEKEAAINKAEGEKRARILEAEGMAEAKIKVAEGEKQSIALVSDTVAQYSNPANYLISIKYIEALQNMTQGKDDKLVYIPYEATGILGAVGAVKELVARKDGDKSVGIHKLFEGEGGKGK